MPIPAPSFALRSALRLETFWQPPEGGEDFAYVLRLENTTDDAIAGFSLCVSGPGRVDPVGRVENATVARRLSNFTEFQPLEGFVLAPGAAWTVSVHALSWPFKHWTDGATGAFLALADGRALPLVVVPTQSRASQAPLKRGAAAYPVPTAFALSGSPAAVSVIPWPRHVALNASGSAPAGFALKPRSPEAEAAVEAFVGLVERLFGAEGLVRPEAEGGAPVVLVPVPGLKPEAHRLRFEAQTVTVEASDQTGFLYGLVTLGQIQRGARLHPTAFGFPASGEIRDEPAMAWRGTHLDVARQFYGTAEMKKFIAVLAWNKLNRLQWHLSDDEAWRVEIDAYPALTTVGAWRGHGLPIPPLLGTGPGRSGGYYTKDAVREIVSFARGLGVEIVPEIDVPGHCYAMLTAVPELRDPGERGEYFSVQGFPNNCLNPALEKTYEVVETVLGELIELFPFRRIHIGADEVPLGAWSGSPVALDWLRSTSGAEVAEKHAARLDVVTNTHGADAIDGSGAALLQAEFIERVQSFLSAKDCVMGAWEEAAHGDRIDRSRSYLCGWRDLRISPALAERGYDVIVSPGQFYYLDMALNASWDEPGASWAGNADAEATYCFDPLAGWAPALEDRVLGVQACIWSEPMSDRAVFDRLIHPRLSALAETGWTTPARKDWERFKALAGLMPLMYGFHEQ